MRHEDQIQMVRRVMRHVEEGTTTYADRMHRNPVSAYTCPERFEREQETVFRKWPLLIGMSNLVAEPGDYVTEDIAGIPAIIVRDRQGKVRAFKNVCRHRGARLVEGEGCGLKMFSCPYHAWTYTLEGRLKGIPDAKSFDEVDKAEQGLFEMNAIEKYGLIFVQPEGEPVDIDEALGGMQRDMEGYGFENFHPYRHLTIRRKFNWKLSPETFMEGYHLQYLHKDTVGPIFFSNLMPFDEFGRNSRLVVPRRRIMELRDRPEDDWKLIPETAIVYTFFPHVTFIMQAGHVEMWRSYPDGAPDRARVEVSVYTPQKVETEKAKAFYDKNIDLAIATVDKEDFPLSEGIQAGHMAAMQDHVTYGRNEPALIHYCTTMEAATA
ncbi:MAG: hypothetical protein TEF_19795 [Rhizobiales bacterium NRL2]|jgi:nitrite reductase/ring-hydroxylating ferredoxin subunit|nr:MAG: hypothetical protein TEF_19795 [Rhizobiales bacterium NRL2]